jgi:hypothetical protein
MIYKGVANSLKEIIKIADGRYEFEGCLNCTLSGMQGFSVRILLRNGLLDSRYVPGLISWAP